MCIMCDGASIDEVRFLIHGLIDRYGWFIQYVESERLSRTWAYTIGLSAGFDHPELVIVGVTPEEAARTLNGLGERVRGGSRFDDGEQIHHCGEDRWFLVRRVHPAHFARGVFAGWDDYYGALGGPMPERRVLEVVPPGRRARLESASSTIGDPPDHRAGRSRPGDGKLRRRPRNKGHR